MRMRVLGRRHYRLGCIGEWMHASVSYLGIWVGGLRIHLYMFPSIVSHFLELARGKGMERTLRQRYVCSVRDKVPKSIKSSELAP